MKQSTRSLWLLALVALLAGFLLGTWVGWRWLPAARTSLSALPGETKDDFVTLVALGFASNRDLGAAKERLQQLEAPNLAQLVAGVTERRAQAGDSGADLSALASLAVSLGIQEGAVAAYLPTATPVPQPTATPIPATATPLPPSPTPTTAPATPTAVPVTQPTDTPAPPTATPTPAPQVVADGPINVRSGPGTDYPVVSALQTGESAAIIGVNGDQSWWQIQMTDGSSGWVYSQIIPTAGNTKQVPTVSDIPAPPPTPTPAAPPTATPAPKPAIDFTLESIRLWGPEENGGYFDGPSLHCGEKRQLRAIVLDAAGQPLNGVTLVGIYSRVEQVTGSKGPGMAEWILGDGDGLRVVRDADGRPVSSDAAEGLVTDPARISDAQFIAAGYCSDAASCQALRDSNACHGHYSWDVTFRRSY